MNEFRYGRILVKGKLSLKTYNFLCDILSIKLYGNYNKQDVK